MHDDQTTLEQVQALRETVGELTRFQGAEKLHREMLEKGVKELTEANVRLKEERDVSLKSMNATHVRLTQERDAAIAAHEHLSEEHIDLSEKYENAQSERDSYQEQNYDLRSDLTSMLKDPKARLITSTVNDPKPEASDPED